MGSPCVDTSASYPVVERRAAIRPLIAARATDEATHWAQVKADAAIRVAQANHDIDRRGDEFDADVAASDASMADDDAAAAIDFAEWAVENARVAILDAIDAHVYAKQKEAAIRR